MGERDGKVCFYCSHCGATSFNEDFIYENDGKCSFCDSDIKEYDIKEVLQKYGVDRFVDLKDNIRNKTSQSIFDTLILNQPDFDISLFKKRNVEEFDVDSDIVLNKNSSSITVECPYCHCSDTKKIKTTGRLVSFGLFGFGSGKIGGKQWHCNTCKSDF